MVMEEVWSTKAVFQTNAAISHKLLWTSTV